VFSGREAREEQGTKAVRGFLVFLLVLQISVISDRSIAVAPFEESLPETPTRQERWTPRLASREAPLSGRKDRLGKSDARSQVSLSDARVFLSREARGGGLGLGKEGPLPLERD
jgi:hypothetical protein